MKKIFTLLSFFSFWLWASTQELTINHHTFTLVTESYDIYNSKGKVMKFYKNIDSQKPLFHITLTDATGGCTGRSLEDGAYEIEGNKIILYSFFHRQGTAYMEPYGAKIVKYEVTKSGKLKKLNSRIYIETAQRGYENSKGMKYLFQKPQTDNEKRDLARYVEQIEEQYQAQFVLGKEGKDLIREVKEALKRKIKQNWSHR